MSSPAGRLDDAALERLFTRPRRFRLVEGAGEPEGPRIWEDHFEHHLLKLVENPAGAPSSDARFTLYVDGEPAGELEELPGLWQLG